ncbi:MAG TPA: type II secretion system protein [Coleofasciculaceae cyanobacterium]|jgi:type II secretory pathway pseudopilin PulG
MNKLFKLKAISSKKSPEKCNLLYRSPLNPPTLGDFQLFSPQNWGGGGAKVRKNLLKITILESSRKEAGFTTLEILISLLIALGFVAVSMQSLVYAMAMKVQAQEKQRANELIQEDIERINRLGSTLPTPPVAATCNSTNYAGGYAQALWTLIPTATQTKTIIKKVKSSDGSVETGGKQLALRRFHVSSTINSNPYRTLKVGYQVWWGWDGTNYKNKNGGNVAVGNEPIAETYVEIIPDVALQCP